MKQITFILIFMSSIVIAQNFTTIDLGTKMPLMSQKLLNIDNNLYSLNDLKGKNGTLIIFSSHTCPFVVMWEDRYQMLEKISDENNIGMIYINSNHMRRDGDDSFKMMQKHAAKMNYSAPYLLDEKSLLANKFGAKTTPHVFLFNSNNKLIYLGAIDDNYNSFEEVTENYVQDAIYEMINKKNITTKKTKAIGCSIKRKAN